MTNATEWSRKIKTEETHDGFQDFYSSFRGKAGTNKNRNETKPQIAASWRVIRGEKEIQHI